MKVSLKSIFAFLLLILSFSMSGNAMDVEACISKCECSQLSESTNDDCSSTSISYSSDYSKILDQNISDVELNVRFVETSFSSSNYRLRRIIEINDSMKDVMRKFLLLRENSLVLDQSKSYFSDKNLHYSTPSSDYYVFALRRILI